VDITLHSQLDAKSGGQKYDYIFNRFALTLLRYSWTVPPANEGSDVYRINTWHKCCGFVDASYNVTPIESSNV
jgi:hypothetical protein